MLQAVQSVKPLEAGSFPRAVLGEELLRALGLAPGDRFSLVTLSSVAQGAGFRFSTVEVAGSFSSGFHEFDRSWLVLLPAAEDRSWEEMAAPVFEADLKEPSAAPRVAEQLRQELGSSALVSDWTQLNRELFAALELQQRVLFLLLGLILLVASFAMGATIAVLGRERRRDLALLKALGLSSLSVGGVVVAFALGLATLGAALGLLFATFLGELATRGGWLSFPPEVAAIYFLSSVPLRLEAIHLGAILALAFGTTLLACLLPMLRLSQGDPAYLLRTE
jgi:lipoprotein-releasing system permease protein